jgi:E3 SUMO-protein ligase NSE2
MPSATTRGFAHQPLEQPLRDEELQQIANLAEAYGENQRILNDHIAKAMALLDKSVFAMNSRNAEIQPRYLRRKARREEAGEEPPPEEHHAERFGSQVEDYTKQMDLAMRGLIDDKLWLGQLPETTRLLGSTNTRLSATQRTSQRSTQLPTQDATPRPRSLDDNMEDEDAEAQALPQAPAYEDTPTAILAAAFAAQAERHSAKTLTERYAHNNDYAGFYRNMHSARSCDKEGTGPPVPAPNAWFAVEEGRELPADDEPDDTGIELVAERTSIKCQITLQPFTEPVEVSTCGHNFEKSAILELLKQSEDFAPYTPQQASQLSGLSNRERQRKERQLRVPRVKCPECSRYLIETDLRPNMALQRHVQRTLAREKRAREQNSNDDDSSMDEGDNPTRGTQRRPFGLGSSPGPPSGAMRASQVKRERLMEERRRSQGPTRSQPQDVDMESPGGMTDEDEVSDQSLEA